MTIKCQGVEENRLLSVTECIGQTSRSSELLAQRRDIAFQRAHICGSVIWHKERPKLHYAPLDPARQSMTFPATMNQASSHRRSRLASSVWTSCMISPTTCSVWQGCRYQHGTPVVGCSPCDSNENEAVASCIPKVVCASGKTSERNSGVEVISESASAAPSAPTVSCVVLKAISIRILTSTMY